MNYRQVNAGTTSVSVVIRIVDSGDGTPETGVVYNTSGIDLKYRREAAAAVAITEASLSALTDAWSSGGFLHIGDGYYRLDVPDAACAAGVAGVLVYGTVTGMIVIGTYVQLIDATTERAATADAILDRNMATGTDSGSSSIRTVRQALRFLRNKWDVSGTTLTVKKEDDSTTSWTGTVTPASGADPISGVDPA